MKLTKTVYLTQSEMWWLEEHYPECVSWGFDTKEYLDAQALAHERNDQYEPNDFEDNLYVDISTAHDEGFDRLRFEYGPQTFPTPRED